MIDPHNNKSEISNTQLENKEADSLCDNCRYPCKDDYVEDCDHFMKF